ncbi:hypothetical protein N4T77_08340 [Clostridium sp. CX1]|nr:hypothetical protein [Clostridium sp. CX1]MCT8976604.1 hypothetical protein [Clostridium sp. CX1]
MRNIIKEDKTRNKEKIASASGILFHEENLTSAGRIIQDAIKQRINK